MKKPVPVIYLLIFVFSFAAIYVALANFIQKFEDQHRKEVKKQSEILLNNVQGRMKLFLDLPLTLAGMGAKYFADKPLNQTNLENLSKDLLTTDRNILGLNLLNRTGRIIAVYPVANNREALRKITQNIGPLKRSLYRDEELWLSKSFPLFQGGEGFAIYTPVKQAGIHKGWIAVVINAKHFATDFNIDQLLKHYEIAILDDRSNEPFFHTSPLPKNLAQVREIREDIMGRKLSFLIWPKKTFTSPISDFGMVAIPFVAALLISLFFYLIWYRKRSKERVHTWMDMLHVSHKEALLKLIEIQPELYKLGAHDKIRYLYDMIEQLDHLRRSIHPDKDVADSDIDVSQVLKAELEDQKDLIKKKRIKIDLRFSPGQEICVHTNASLFQHSVMSNIITHAIFQAQNGSVISIDARRLNGNHMLTFRIQHTQHFDFDEEVTEFKQHLQVARNILQMYGGKIEATRDMAGGILIQLTLPHYDRHSWQVRLAHYFKTKGRKLSSSLHHQ